MTETNQMILDRIKAGVTIKELASEFNLTHRQLYNRINQIEGQGYIVNRNYNTNGNLSYSLHKDGYYRQGEFYLKNSQRKPKIMVISDLHIGNIKGNIELINTVYDYCAKEDIHNIIICGDLLDGTFSQEEIIIDPEKQIDYLIKNYPFDESILNIFEPGDHDISLQHNTKMSLHKVLTKKRHDIANIAPCFHDKQDSIITINHNKIQVSHKSSYTETNTIDDVKLHLCGHMHSLRELYNINSKTTPRIYIPPLCRINFHDEINLPRAVELDLFLDSSMNLEVIEKKDLILINERIAKTGETFINYSDKDIDVYVYGNSRLKHHKQKQH